VGERRAARILRAGLDALLAVTLAPHCAACAAVLDRPSLGPICDGCWASTRLLFPPLCRTCGDPLPSWRVISAALSRCARCRRRSPVITLARAAGEYDGRLRDIIHAFKYEARPGLAGPLGTLARDAGREVLADATFVVPVPLHPVRRISRGFNQAHELAREMGLPIVHALWRRRLTRPQTGLDARMRRRNMRDAFVVSPFCRRARLAGSIVVLVDDVRTTGATLEACAEVLLDAGVREVRALTVATAVRKGT
jgi:ComF family protein